MKVTRARVLGFLFVSFGAGVFTDVLARQAIFGLNFLVWSLVWIIILGAIALRTRRLSLRFGWYASLVLLNAGLVYVRSETVVQFWSVTLALLILTLAALHLHVVNFAELTLTKRWVAWLVGMLSTIGRLVRTVNTKRYAHTKLDVPLGAVIALPISLLFIALFSSSDTVFGNGFSFIGDIVQSIGDWLGSFDIGRVISIGFWTMCSLIALGFSLRHTLVRDSSEIRLASFMKTGDSLIILGSVTAIFAIYVMLQIRYLFAGAELPDGLTYAAYARRGYGELLLVTLLASAVIYFTVMGAKMRTQAVKYSATALSLLNAAVVLAAWKRLSLYESAYGWTMTRFVARMGLVCVSFGILYLLARVWGLISRHQLFVMNWYTVTVILIAAAMINPVGLITKKNLTELKYREVELDTVHLLTLSPDSYAAICQNIDAIKDIAPAKYEQIRARHALGKLWPLDTEFSVDRHMSLEEKSNSGLSRHWVFTKNNTTIARSCLNKQ